MCPLTLSLKFTLSVVEGKRVSRAWGLFHSSFPRKWETRGWGMNSRVMHGNDGGVSAHHERGGKDGKVGEGELGGGALLFGFGFRGGRLGWFL